MSWSSVERLDRVLYIPSSHVRNKTRWTIQDKYHFSDWEFSVWSELQMFKSTNSSRRLWRNLVNRQDDSLQSYKTGAVHAILDMSPSDIYIAQ
jgi:hypothetical protein